ncbi:histone-fold-containing protein [Patellaria atrata CBS 101060]|uniref:Histone-fold-containing protein n=1 Tax=Patellaria atrata CBS 101060 TaxID=1346257 RepID=A0A9P4SA34_9PEZI|nr:histone-fold-containing protein [Patellaria atrata CBS 101060]
MPYNNTPIAPPSEFTGSVSLPLARVKKIIHADDDIASCSNNAAFVITVATEMFVQYLVEQTHNVVKAERKPRRNIQYKDVANAVARIDNLEFLSDVVPRTTTYKKAKEAISKAVASATNGQSTLATRPQSSSGPRLQDQLLTAVNGHPHAHPAKREDDDGDTTVEEMDVDDVEEEDPSVARVMETEVEDPAALQLEMEMKGQRNGVNGRKVS